MYTATQNYTFSQIPNWFIECLTLFNFNESHVDLLLVLARMSWGFHRDYVDIARSQLSKRAAMAESQVTRNINELISYNVISRETGHYGHVFKINLPDQWRIPLKGRAKAVPVPALYTINNEHTSPSMDKGHSQSPGGGHSQSPGGGHSQSPMKEKNLKEKTTTNPVVVVSLPSAEKNPPPSVPQAIQTTPEYNHQPATETPAQGFSGHSMVVDLETARIGLLSSTNLVEWPTVNPDQPVSSTTTDDHSLDDAVPVMPICSEATQARPLSPALVDTTHLQGLLHISLSEKQKRGILKQVSHLENEDAKEILKSLHESIEAGKVRNPGGYLGGIIKNFAKGSFSESTSTIDAATRAEVAERLKAEEVAKVTEQADADRADEIRKKKIDGFLSTKTLEQVEVMRQEWLASLGRNNMINQYARLHGENSRIVDVAFRGYVFGLIGQERGQAKVLPSLSLPAVPPAPSSSPAVPAKAPTDQPPVAEIKNQRFDIRGFAAAFDSNRTDPQRHISEAKGWNREVLEDKVARQAETNLEAHRQMLLKQLRGNQS